MTYTYWVKGAVYEGYHCGYVTINSNFAFSHVYSGGSINVYERGNTFTFSSHSSFQFQTYWTFVGISAGITEDPTSNNAIVNAFVANSFYGPNYLT